MGARVKSTLPMDSARLGDAHQYIVGVVQGGFFVIEGRETHALEMAPVPLFTPHHDPHGAPLGNVYRFYNQRDLIYKADGSCDVVQNLDLLDLNNGTRTNLRLPVVLRDVLWGSVGLWRRLDKVNR